jgi:cytosine/adenosine deaminase-related metal-dependent hydrolase
VPSSLIRGKYVIVRALDRERAVVVEDGAVFQRDGVIVKVGPYEEIAGRYRPDRMLGSADHLVLPGMVDGHHHLGLTPFQLGVPDDALEPWLVRRRGMRHVDPYLDTLYSAFELLESGVTTVVHLQGRLPRSLDAAEYLAARVLKAYEDVGIRASWAYMLRDQNQLVYQADDEFIAGLPAALQADATAGVNSLMPVDESLAFFESLHARYKDHDRLAVQLAPGTMRSLSDGALLKIKACAAKHRVPLHIHLLETVYQTEHAGRRAGKTGPAHLEEIGFLGPDVTLGHAVWLTQADIEIVARTGTLICHNPSSNLRLRSGIAPLNAYLAAGVPVALGIDESGINEDRDMLQEMRLALRLHRPPGMSDADVPSPTQIFQMASENGARTTPFSGRIGTLEPGKAADLVLMQWRQMAYPYLDPGTSPIDALVMRGKAPVDTVMVGGEVVMEHGRFTRVNRDEVLADLAQSLGGPLTPEEEHRRAFADALVPHTKRFCEAFLSDRPREPYYTTSSRV